MLKSSLYFKCLLLAIFLTLLSIVLQPLLPVRKLKLSPGSYENLRYYLMPVANDPDNKKAFFIDIQESFHFRCVMAADDINQPCNLMFELNNDYVNGIDLSQFKSIRFNMTYQGTIKGVRLSMRNFDPRFSTAKDSNSGKFQWVFLRAGDIKGAIEVPLQEFVVADWWRDQYNLSRDQTHQDFSNVIVFSIDFNEDLSNSVQEIKVSDIEFVGPWVSKEQWYLWIILIWIAGGTIFAIWQLVYLIKKEKAQSKRISDLLVKNSRLEDETDKFRRLSTVDALTNAFNRYGIEQIIESLESQAEPIAVIIFDIDNFKRVNDKRGHDCGDRVLLQVSNIVMARTRASDKFGRWGGEEFILICPNTSLGMAVALAEKLRIYFASTVFEPGNPLIVTASFGVASVHQGESFPLALKRADEALYKAKEFGRNCVIVAESETDFPLKYRA